MRLNREEVKASVLRTVQRVLKLEAEVDPEADLRSLGLDSMKSVALIVDLEETFGIIFDDDELIFEYFSTCNKIVERVENKLLQKEAI